METHQHSHSDNVYACPMHPKETGKQGDKCSECGMDFELVQKDNLENIEIKITSAPQKIDAGKLAQLAFSITENGKNASLEVGPFAYRR